MNRFVYRMAFTTYFVYREIINKIHKLFCGWQNSHKRLCGFSFLFQHSQASRAGL